MRRWIHGQCPCILPPHAVFDTGRPAPPRPRLWLQVGKVRPPGVQLRKDLDQVLVDTTFESRKNWRIESAPLKSTTSRPEGGTHEVMGLSAVPEARLLKHED
jgi:hypothetical protein